jgi:hypothetical protein
MQTYPLIRGRYRGLEARMVEHEDALDKHRILYLSNLLLAHPCFITQDRWIQRNQLRRLLRTEGNPLFCFFEKDIFYVQFQVRGEKI